MNKGGPFLRCPKGSIEPTAESSRYSSSRYTSLEDPTKTVAKTCTSNEEAVIVAASCNKYRESTNDKTEKCFASHPPLTSSPSEASRYPLCRPQASSIRLK